MKALSLAIALLLAPGCVSMKKYQDLETHMEKVQSENQRLRDQIARQEAAARARMEDYRQLMADLKPLIDKGLLEVEVVDGRVVIGMAADVLFASGSAALSEAGKGALTEVGRVLARKGEYEWQVEGHTDDDAIATAQFPNNWYLGAARAITVVEHLMQAGMDAGSLSAASFGQFAPVSPNNSPTAKARNRRIELVLLPDLSELPGYGDMMKENKARPGRKPRRTPPPPPPRGGN